MSNKGGQKRLSAVQRQRLKKGTLLYFVSFICLWLIILSFTPFTYHLDEIKVSMTYFFGPWLLFLFLLLITKRGLTPPPRIVVFPLLAYFGALVISLIFSSFKWVGWIVIGQHLALAGFFFAFAVSMVTKDHILKAIYIFVWITIMTTVFGILQYTGLFALIKKWFFPGQPARIFDYTYILVNTFASARDMFSTILNRDFFSGFLVMLLPISLAGVIIFESPGKRLLSAISIILALACIYLAFSKDSFGATLLVLAFFIIVYQRSIRYKRLYVPHLHIWILGLVIILGTLLFFTQQIVLPKLKGIDRSFESRSIIWYGGWRQFLDRPVIGNGPGTFRILFPKYRRPDYMEHDISNVTLYSHNRYLDLLCETGVVGFLTYMWFTGAVLFLGLRQIFRGKDPTLRVAQLGLTASIIGLLFTNFFSPSVRWVVIGTTYWSILGISLGCSLFERYSTGMASRQANKPGTKNIKTNLYIAWVIIVGILSVASSVYAVRYFVGAVIHNKGLQWMSAAEAYSNPAERTTQLKLYRKARDSFLKAIKYNPTFITSYYKLGHVYSNLGDVDRALETYKTLQKYAPDYAEIHFNLGVLYLRKGNIKLARKHIQEAARESIKEQTRFAAGNIFMQYGEFKEAERYFLDVLSINPKNLAARKSLVSIYRLLKQPDKAEQYLLSLYEDYPEDDQILWALISVYRNQGKWDELIDFLKKAIQNNPLAFGPRFYLMQALYERGKYRESLQQGQVLVKLNFKNQTLFYLMARLYQKLGDKENMYKFLQTTVAMDKSTSEGKTAESLLRKLKLATKKGK